MRRLLLVAALACGAALQPASAGAVVQAPCIAGQVEPICMVQSAKVEHIADGDTLDVHIYGAPGGRIRITGVQAMEQTVYSDDPTKERGECHALEARTYLAGLVGLSHGQARVLGQNRLSRSRHRPLRALEVKIRGKWRDAGSLLIARGHALWLASKDEWAWNGLYSWLAQRAARRGVNLWDTTYCGPGPDDDIPIRLDVHPDARGDDFLNLNGESVLITNLGTRDLSLAGWWLRDSGLRRYTFGPGVVLAPGASVRLRVGRGTDTARYLYWGLRSPIFENPTRDTRMGDGAYLFDPQGDLRAWDMYPCRYDCRPGQHHFRSPTTPQPPAAASESPR